MTTMRDGWQLLRDDWLLDTCCGFVTKVGERHLELEHKQLTLLRTRGAGAIKMFIWAAEKCKYFYGMPKKTNIPHHQTLLMKTTRTPLFPRRCKTGSVGQSAGLVIPRSSVRFRQKLENPRTRIYMDSSYIDLQTRVVNYCYNLQAIKVIINH